MPGHDPWAHRSAGMSCATCMWFVEKDGGILGRCRKHAPTMSGYPVVYPSDWCGDHKLDHPPGKVEQAVAIERAPQPGTPLCKHLHLSEFWRDNVGQKKRTCLDCGHIFTAVI